ncbi:conserved hypothetical protein [Ricinus communis]|uniref:Uncharacterized protein n=1 Tax=Ricinus communis TaxID=3988 RepID=B9RX56_RICCO|nr:conserved hypothetical protein [Ricinus communis]
MGMLCSVVASVTRILAVSSPVERRGWGPGQFRPAKPTSSSLARLILPHCGNHHHPFLLLSFIIIIDKC